MDNARAWATIVGQARQPSIHARIIAAAHHAGNDPERRMAAYRKLFTDRAYAELDTLPLSASQLAELAVAVAAGEQGVNASRLDGVVKAYLIRHRLLTRHPASRFPLSDWRALLAATLAGRAVVRAAQGNPVTLTADEAIPLAVIERAMRTTAERGVTGWPGTSLTLRMAQAWRLAEYVRSDVPPSGQHWSGQLGVAVYRLTAEGVATLERHRREQTGTTPTINVRCADILMRVDAQPNGDLGVLIGKDIGALQKCLDAGWVREGAPLPVSARRRLRLTADGRKALEGWMFRERAAQAAPPEPTWDVGLLKVGQEVRLSNRNRRDYPGVGPEWVTVVDIKHVRKSTGARLENNYEVWVTDDCNPRPYLYAGRSLFRAVRFHVRNT